MSLKSSFILFVVIFHVASVGTLAPAPVKPLEDCPMTCLADSVIQTYGPEFIVLFSNVTSGTGKEETCATCTLCKGTVGYTYVGGQRWTLGVVFEGGGGVSTGQGSTAGAFTITSGCDDTSPGAVAMDVGNPPMPGFTAQLFCGCN